MTEVRKVSDIQEARKILVEANFLGLVSLVDYLVTQLEKGYQIQKLGMCLGSFKQANFGRNDGKRTPLEDLIAFANIIVEKPEVVDHEGLKMIDKGCGEFVKVFGQLERGEYEEVLSFCDDDDFPGNEPRKDRE